MGEAVSNGNPPEEKDQRNGEAGHSTSTNGVQSTNEGSSFASYTSNNESSSHLPASAASSDSSTDQNIFLSSSMDGSLRIWDRRQAAPAAISIPARGVPPWCMQACWSTDGNWIYAGRRNGTVEEYSVHKGIHESTRTLKFPNPSGPVSAVYPMPNGRNLMW
jgi:transcriptional activator SPT8